MLDLFWGHGLNLLLPLAPLAPLFMLLALARPCSRQKLVTIAPWSALPALLLGLLLPTGIQLDLPGTWWQAGLILDEVGRFFLVLNALLWLLSGIFATAWFRGEHAGSRREHLFMAFFLATMAGHFGLTLAQDIPTFYLCFALMGFSSYGLIVHDQTWSSRRAGRLYLFMLMVGELGLFGGVALAATQSTAMLLPGLDGSWVPGFAAVMLFALGLGIKAGMLGGHAWLPLAHPAAPVPASAVLSGVMIKAGLFGWLRLTPLETGWTEAWSEAFFGAMMLLGAVAAVYAAVVGLWQKTPKTILAYSSVSQMGWLTLLLGAYLAYPAYLGSSSDLGQTALMLFILHHALAKGALFLGVGILQRSAGAFRRLAWWLLLLPAAALAGFPATSGILAKHALDAVVGPLAGNMPLVPLLFLATLGTTLLMGRFLLTVGAPRPDAQVKRAMDPGLWLPWLFLLGLSATLPWLWLLVGGFGEAADWIGAVWSFDALRKASGPLLLGGFVVIMAICRPWPKVRTFGAAFLKERRIRRHQRERGLRRWWHRRESAAMHFEHRLQQWPAAGRALILLAVLLGASVLLAF
ncbi:complex I subunit 5 family protein [Desulfonatronum thioautotrophicum]|uniref:complex I subunit 5 family protein n=1 Tax=Desulfonatronum thioautotrophicum TaxID=617001 RepID=UPI000AC00D26|nr:complex I subunit 5 family protein [Desulfonatronum thioautotrophicum]